jgi:hypothetical protein
VIVADEGVCDADHSAGDGDEGDFCGFSCGAQVEIDLLEPGMASHRDEGGHVEGGAQAGTAPGDGVAPEGKSRLRRMGREACEARGLLSSDFAQLRHFDDDQGGDARSNAGHRGQNGAPARHSVLGFDAAVEFGLDRPASVLEQGDHLPAGVENQRIEGLLEAGLLDRDRFGQLPPPCRQRLETRLSGVPERSLGTVSLRDLERMVA